MAESGIDVLMKVVGVGGTAYAAESYTTFAGLPVNDPLRRGFTPGQFCELQSFNFSIGAESAMSKGKDAEGEAGKGKPGEQSNPAGQRFGREPDSATRTIGSASSSGGLAGSKPLSDDVDIKAIDFTRIVDSMSTQLFSALVGCDTLDSITVIKRRASGLNNSGACYLRLDFTKVLITELEWKDSQHLMIESGSFIYRKVNVLYRPQKPDGSLDVAIEAKWEMPARK